MMFCRFCWNFLWLSNVSIVFYCEVLWFLRLFIVSVGFRGCLHQDCRFGVNPFCSGFGLWRGQQKKHPGATLFRTSFETNASFQSKLAKIGF